jgi:limonene-1,2-epoxide hydrolase
VPILEAPRPLDDALSLDCVRRFVEAGNRRDLLRAHELLDRECTWWVNDRLVSSGADDAALLLAVSWERSPLAVTVVDHVGVAGGVVTVRDRRTDACLPGSEKVERDIVAYTVFEVVDRHITRIREYVKTRR